MMFIHCDFLGHAFLSLQQCYSSKKWKTYKLVFRVLIQKVLSMIHWFIWSLASSVLVWRIPGMEEPGGLPSMGPHRVGHDWSDLAAIADRNPPASSVHGILQARILEWVAISFLRGSSQLRDRTCISCVCCTEDRFKIPRVLLVSLLLSISSC